MSNEKKKRILFVDDELKILDGLRRMLRSMRHEWQMVFAKSGQEALDFMSNEPFEVVVTDIHMPGMNGFDFLEKVRKRHRNSVRFVLSGSVDKEIIIRSANLVHQHISKPCDAEILKSALTRTFELHDLLANDRLRELITQIQSLPSLSSISNALVKKFQSENVTINEVVEIISQDISMITKILQLSNTVLCWLSNRTTNLMQAVTSLGLDTVKVLVISNNEFSQFDQAKMKDLYLDELWEHSAIVGACAKLIMNTTDIKLKLGDQAFMAGMLHDIGRLVLAMNCPEEYASSLSLGESKSITSSEAEHETFETTHSEVGGYLLGLWGLPDPIVKAVTFHHNPMELISENFSTVTAVNVADFLTHEACHSKNISTTIAINSAYIAKLGLTERLPQWREMCHKEIFCER